MKIFFVRHGETVFGKEEKFEGSSDSPLTDKGKRQIRKLGEFCKQNNVEKIISSPLKRAKVTAEEIGKACGVKVEFSDLFREICYGEWENKSKIKLQKLKIWKNRRKNLFKFVHPGSYNGHKGESYEMLFLRLKPFFKTITKENKNIVIVSHTGVMRCAKKYFEHIDSNAFNSLSIQNNYVYIVEVNRNNTNASSCLV